MFTPTLVFVLIEKICEKNLRLCSIQTPQIAVKNSPLHVVISIPFSVFKHPDETLSLVFDIFYFQHSVVPENNYAGLSHGRDSPL